MRVAASALRPVVGMELDCVPVDLLLHVSRRFYDLLDRCDPDAEPMLGIID